MLGHLVSNGYPAGPQIEAPRAPAAGPKLAAVRQSGWFSRLLTQLLPRR
jgi:hypothetical protein